MAKKFKSKFKKELSKIGSEATRVSSKIEKRIREGESKALKQKILKKPTAKGITPVSARKTLKGFAHSTGPMVREVPPEGLVEDERSLYFTKELEKEERSVNKWLS